MIQIQITERDHNFLNKILNKQIKASPKGFNMKTRLTKLKNRINTKVQDAK